MKEYRFTLLFTVVSIAIIGVATFMVYRSTEETVTVAIVVGLFTGLVGFILAADVIISRSNRRRQEHEVETARLAYLLESRRRIVAAQERVRKEIALRLHGSVQNKIVLLMHRLSELEQSASPELAADLASLQGEFL